MAFLWALMLWSLAPEMVVGTAPSDWCFEKAGEDASKCEVLRNETSRCQWNEDRGVCQKIEKDLKGPADIKKPWKDNTDRGKPGHDKKPPKEAAGHEEDWCECDEIEKGSKDAAGHGKPSHDKKPSKDAAGHEKPSHDERPQKDAAGRDKPSHDKKPSKGPAGHEKPSHNKKPSKDAAGHEKPSHDKKMWKGAYDEEKASHDKKPSKDAAGREGTPSKGWCKCRKVDRDSKDAAGRDKPSYDKKLSKDAAGLDKPSHEKKLSKDATGRNKPSHEKKPSKDAAGTDSVSMVLRLKNLEYASLMKNAKLHSNLVEQVKESIAFAAGAGIKEGHVSVTIKPGSIIAEASIVPPAGVKASTIVQELSTNPSTFEEELAAKISSVPGIEDIQTGPVTASMSQAPKVVVAQTSAPNSRTQKSKMIIIIAASSAGASLVCCCALIGFCIGRSCSPTRKQKVGLSPVSDKHIVTGAPETCVGHVVTGIPVEAVSKDPANLV